MWDFLIDSLVNSMRLRCCWALIFAPATQISLANGTRALTVHGWATVKLFIAVALLPISTVAPVEIITLDPPSDEFSIGNLLEGKMQC
ncbi:hypothetical protein TNIN_176541 [Trichonephila inaurata madagascariensis]|uniref:Uncharacterized protein n=1 Tax=Trichonephila inaurata madagascariensis TaxID=2747483 RepID=A0A8X6WYA9_9ARAC|nr:hypothetical protein TNIN_176541 [Trichonephila inaurata madagascariensis]